ncbi:glycosyltransferase [Gelidibacter salicanalis]|uniref:Glycosyltransferase family 1 protein n=1 Tax=Gelidibacter salicanalis TaxID=291193 RepID=A0A934NHS8_9FLAO|nr:glycosyltransferase [Gelidibacter salicanalis]MBJ7879254.1 glycosyltransferase family 1 protein [Gelidibacter salicanalis]
MRILLVGEYSRLHNSLKEGLTDLGHEVVLMGNKDGFKGYPVDIYINHSFQNRVLHKIKVGAYKLTGLDLGSLEIVHKVKKQVNSLARFDVVQLINESAFSIQPKAELELLQFLKTKTDKLFVLSCSYDHASVKFMLNNGFTYSALTPYLENNSLKDHYKFKLQYLNEDFSLLHQYVVDHSNGIISTDLDYHLPLVGKPNYLGLIPNPINTDKISYIPIKTDGKIKIFHGINTHASLTKGNMFFTKALKIIEEKYADKVEITITTNIPYKEYIQRYNDCHILLDMVYAYDQGYNALEAMGKGKVVFTGAEQEWLGHYNLEADAVAINAQPDVAYLVEKLSWLIEHPEKIKEISLQARAFIEREHYYKNIAQQYLETWSIN